MQLDWPDDVEDEILDPTAPLPALPTWWRRVPWYKVEGSRIVGRIGQQIVEVRDLDLDEVRFPLPPDVFEAAVHALVKMLRAELPIRFHIRIPRLTGDS
jgi:hypothetical protein